MMPLLAVSRCLQEQHLCLLSLGKHDILLLLHVTLIVYDNRMCKMTCRENGGWLSAGDHLGMGQVKSSTARRY